MQKRTLVVLATICGLVVAATSMSRSVLLASSGAARAEDAAPAQESSKESDPGPRIARIENGLTPINIRGEVKPTTNIADHMTYYKVPGLSVAFFDQGKIVWTRTYGFADPASKKPVTTETLFQAASISKPVSALAALRLVQDGRLSLDENINSKLHSWTVPENRYTQQQKVNLGEILSHTAGFSVHGFSGYATGEHLPTVLQILNGQNPANSPPILVDAVPGSIWQYSGGGYVVLQLLLTDVTGKLFPQIIHDLVLAPAGMTHSTYEQPLPANLAAAAAIPYRENGDPVQGGWHTYPEMAAAGLWTTPSDLALMAIEVQYEYAGKSSRILSQQMTRQMLTPQKGSWGLGFSVEAPGQPPRFGHDGANEGYRCDLEVITESGQGIAIMTNSDAGDKLIRELLRAVSKEYKWPYSF